MKPFEILPLPSLAILAALFLLVPGFATTLVVQKDGTGDASSITLALEMLDYNDGEDDVVLIGPGVYDEQIKPKGNAGVDSVPFPDVFNVTLSAIENAYLTHSDRLTLMGLDPSDPPVLTAKTATIRPYGFFPDNPSDFSLTALLFCGNDVTYSNLEIRNSGGAEYAMNGQAANVAFEDCLFTNGMGVEQSHDDFCLYQNNANLTSALNPNIGADNSYSYSNCLIDGRSLVDGSLFASAFAYFHGYDDGSLPGETEPFGGILMEGCLIRNWDDTFHYFRGRSEYPTGFASTRVEDCYFENVTSLFRWQGNQGPGVFNRNVVKHVSGNSYVLRFHDRGGAMPNDFIVANSLFVGTPFIDFGVIHADFIGTNNQSDQNPRIRVVNNTFHGYTGSAVQIGGQDPVGEAIIANNIFSGTGENASKTGISILNESIQVELLNNLFFNNTSDVIGAPDVDQGSVFANPSFLTETVTEPTSPGAATEQGLVPSSSSVAGQGETSVYLSLLPLIGDRDVDGNPRNLNSVDIGAQVVGETPPTSTPTQTPTATATPTPTNPPPSDPMVSIQPEEPFTFNDLLCNATGSVDPDGGDVTYSFKWFRDGLDLTIENETDFSGPTVPSEATTRDEVWRCEVTAEDDEGQQSFGNAQVTIQNSFPTQPDIHVIPENPLPKEGRAVILVTFSTDADNDPFVYFYQWFRLDDQGNWQLRPEVSGTFQPFSPGEAEISGLYTAGETWKVEVYAIESRFLVKRSDSKGRGFLEFGPPAIEEWIVLPDFGNDGKIDNTDILILLELWRNEGKAVAPETYRDLILISTLGWQGKAEGGE